MITHKFIKLNKSAVKKRIQDLRFKTGLSQSDLADMIGMSRQGYSMAERKDSTTFFTIEQMLNMGYIFKVALEYIVEGKGENNGMANEERIKQLEAVSKEKDHEIKVLKEKVELQARLIKALDK